MKIFCFSSKNNQNVAAAIGKETWGYTKTQKSHGNIKPGDYVLLYSQQSKCIECVGIVLTEPDFGVEIKDDVWEGSYFDPFSFKVVAKKSIPLDELKNILEVGTDINFNHYLSLFYPDTPAKISSEDIGKIIKEME